MSLHVPLWENIRKWLWYTYAPEGLCVLTHAFCKMQFPWLFSRSNPIALRRAKIVYNFGLFECNRVNMVHLLSISGQLSTEVEWCCNREQIHLCWGNLKIGFYNACCSFQCDHVFKQESAFEPIINLTHYIAIDRILAELFCMKDQIRNTVNLQ